MKKKQCWKCKKRKLLKEFPRNKGKPDGRHGRCLECARKNGRSYNEKDSVRSIGQD